MVYRIANPLEMGIIFFILILEFKNAFFVCECHTVKT
jgi:hypothetical protein